jgi:hypothetical protein
LLAIEVPYLAFIMIEKFAKSRAKRTHFLLGNVVIFLCHSTVQEKQKFALGTEFSGRGECVNDIFVEWVRKMGQ